MDPGSTFRGYDKGNHLFIVLSAPDGRGRVILVSFTTHELTRTECNDDCLVFARGDHEFIRHDTCVAFWRIKFDRQERLEGRRDRGELEMREPLSPEVLLRIQQGALDAPRVKDKPKRLVRRSMTT